MRFRASALLAILVWAAGAARAGVFVETVERDAKTGKVTATQTIQVQSGNARLERQGKDIVILKGDELTMIDPARRSYSVADRAALAKVSGRMNDATAQMREQMAQMNPEERAMMQRMTGGRMPGAAGARPPATIDVVDTKRSEQVDGRTCRVWDVKRNGVLDEQLCVVPFASLPGKEDLRAVFERLDSLTAELRKATAAFSGDAGAEYEALAKVNGFPVLTRDFENGKPTGREKRVSVWREEAVAASQFDVPSGYRKRELAEGM